MLPPPLVPEEAVPDRAPTDRKVVKVSLIPERALLPGIDSGGIPMVPSVPVPEEADATPEVLEDVTDRAEGRVGVLCARAGRWIDPTGAAARR